MLKASMIIPLFQEKNLDIILDSLQNQTEIQKDEFEVVLVNDGGEPCYPISNRSYDYSVKYVEHPSNLGRSSARNTGARHANAELLIFSDGDRILNPKFIARHISAQERIPGDKVIIGNPVELLCPNVDLIRNNINTMVNDSSHCIWRYAYHQRYAEMLAMFFDDNGATGCDVPWAALFSANFSIHKKLYWTVGGFDEWYRQWGYENIDFGLQLYKQCVAFHYVKDIVNYHIYHKQDRGINPDGKAYLLKKYQNHKKLTDYFGFLDGSLSLYEFSDAEVGESKDNYFSANKFGSKYRLNI